jgi:hypothetical protein
MNSCLFHLFLACLLLFFSFSDDYLYVRRIFVYNMIAVIADSLLFFISLSCGMISLTTVHS